MPSPKPTPRTRGRKLQTLRAAHLYANPLCVACARVGRVRAAVEVDHIVPLYKGGTDTEDNRQGLCVECHADKTRDDMGHEIQAKPDTNGVPTNPLHPWAAERTRKGEGGRNR